MSLSQGHLPAIRTAIEVFRDTIAAWKPYQREYIAFKELHLPASEWERRGHYVKHTTAVCEAENRLRRCLSPNNSDWCDDGEHGSPPDLDNSDLPLKPLNNLREL